MIAILDKIEDNFDAQDLGKLVLRVSFSLMLLLHGIAKINNGTSYIEGLFMDMGLPASLAYLAYLGEVIAPIMVALGIYTRTMSAMVIGTCVVVIGLLHTGDLFSLNKYGAWAVEGIGTYLFAAIAVFFLGSGKYALKPNS